MHIPHIIPMRLAARASFVDESMARL